MPIPSGHWGQLMSAPSTGPSAGSVALVGGALGSAAACCSASCASAWSREVCGSAVGVTTAVGRGDVVAACGTSEDPPDDEHAVSSAATATRAAPRSLTGGSPLLAGGARVDDPLARLGDRHAVVLAAVAVAEGDRAGGDVVRAGDHHERHLLQLRVA